MTAIHDLYFLQMISFPNAKINLGLNIVGKRPDGYHNIESCFYPVPWRDILEIVKSDCLQFTASGLPISGPIDSNLCVKAYQLIKARYQIPPVKIHLHKAIPMGAGLGGGSANGAFALKMLNGLFELGIAVAGLQSMAARLGGDCPFFIENRACYVTGTGTDLESIDLDLTGKFIALKNPGIHISTKEAYSNVLPKPSEWDIRKTLKEGIPSWKGKLHNDFEDSIFPKHPAIKRVKNDLYKAGASYASMTGSGSTVYGIFDEKPTSLQHFEVFEL